MNIRSTTLEGRSVRLEPLTMEHLTGLAEVALDPDIWRLQVSQIETKAQLRAYMQDALAAEAAGTALPFATIDVASGRVIGSTRYGNIDHPNRRVEIGWTWLGTAWQRTASNTEAKYLMLRHAFETLGCIRVEFKTDSLNEKSRRALARIGAREEGIFRNHMIVDSGRIRHSVYFS
ncbi:MAG: GNAT family protein, partial [Gemmatimonadota bacterium]